MIMPSHTSLYKFITRSSTLFFPSYNFLPFPLLCQGYIELWVSSFIGGIHYLLNLKALVRYKPGVKKGQGTAWSSSICWCIAIIPKVLAQNSGFDLQETLVKVQAEHSESGQLVGVDLNAGEPMVAAEAGIWDNYCVKKQLLRSWLWLPPTFSWLMRSWELECPLQKVEMKLALYLNPEDHRVILIIQLWNFAPIFKGFSFPILKKERTLAPIQILKFWNYNYSICKIALKCPHIAGHTYPVNRTFCFTLSDTKILDNHMLSTLLLNIHWKTNFNSLIISSNGCILIYFQ